MRALSAAFSVALALLAGCGGSGNSDPVQENLATITSMNAPVIAGAVVGSALEAEGLDSFASFGPSASPVSAKTSTALFSKLGEAQVSSSERLKQQALSGFSQAPFGPETVMCQGTGEMTISGDIADAGTLSMGDVFTIDYDFCDQGDGIVIDGTFSMSVTDFSGDLLSGMMLFGVEVTLTGFSIDDGTDSATVDGRVQITIDTQMPPVTSVSISTASMTVTDGVSSHTLTDFSITQTLDSSATSYSLAVSGSLTSSAFEGRVDFSTTLELRGAGSGFAFTGEILITGAGGATISVVAVDDVSVRLEVDVDGDGDVDETVDTTWSELSA